MMKANMRPVVNVRIEVGNERTGKVEKVIEAHNLVTDAGLILMRDLFREAPDVHKVTHIAFGNGTTAPELSDTTLEDERFRGELVLEPLADAYSGLAFLYYSHYLGSAAGSLGAISEAGLLTAATGGTLFARLTFEPISKTLDTYVKVEWYVGWQNTEL